PTPTTRRTRSSARRAISTRRAPRRTCDVRSSRTTTPTGTSTRSSRSPRRCPTATGPDRVSDPGRIAGARARGPQPGGVRVRGQHAAAALLAGTSADALGPAEALARELLEPVVAELGGGRTAGAGARADAAQGRLDSALGALQLDELRKARLAGPQRR